MTTEEIREYVKHQIIKVSTYTTMALILIAAILVKVETIDIKLFWVILSVLVTILSGIIVYFYPSYPPDGSYWMKNAIPKLILFTGYHLVIFTLGWVFITWALKPMFENPWIYGLDWLRKSVIVVFIAGVITSAIMSILSCWTSKALKEDEIGQLIIGNWMPNFGKNEKNVLLIGIFTGLPKWLVTVSSIKATVKTVPKESTLQIPKAGTTPDEQFEAVIKWKYMWMVADTKRSILAPHTDADIVNAVETILIRRTNTSPATYSGITELKRDKNIFEQILRDELAPYLLELYGIKTTAMDIEAIELPQGTIDQQNTEERQRIDMIHLRKRARDLIAEVETLPGNQSMSMEKALEIVQAQEGRVQVTVIRGGGVPVVSTPPPVPPPTP